MPIKPTTPRTRPTKAKTPGAAKAAAAGKSPKLVKAKPAGARSQAMGEMPVIDMAAGLTPLGETEGAAADQDEGAASKAKSGQGASLIRLKHLIEQVAEATGSKKQDVKPIIEATLARLGALLGQGESLSLQGFGNLRVIRPATADSPVIRLKLRLADAGKGKVAPDEED